MVKIVLDRINYLSILFLLPLLTGCNGGGSAAGTGAQGLAADITGGGGGGAGFATIHNPEPTSMLLMGGGMMAVALYKKSLKK